MSNYRMNYITISNQITGKEVTMPLCDYLLIEVERKRQCFGLILQNIKRIDV